MAGIIECIFGKFNTASPVEMPRLTVVDSHAYILDGQRHLKAEGLTVAQVIDYFFGFANGDYLRIHVPEGFNTEKLVQMLQSFFDTQMMARNVARQNPLEVHIHTPCRPNPGKEGEYAQWQGEFWRGYWERIDYEDEY